MCKNLHDELSPLGLMNSRAKRSLREFYQTRGNEQPGDDARSEAAHFARQELAAEYGGFSDELTGEAGDRYRMASMRATKKRRTQAGAEERYLQKVDRAVSRYGAQAVAKYFVPGVERVSGYYGRYAPVGSEMKFFDTQLSFTFDTTTEVPATGQLVLIPQGVTESQRIGRKCIIKSIEVTGSMTNSPAAAANASVNAYLWLVWDKQCNGAAAAVADVFSNTGTPAEFTRNMANSSRFVILKKWIKVFDASAGVTTAYNSTRRPINFYKKCSIPLEYSSTTGAITEIKSNNLFLIAGALGGDDTVTMLGTCRVRFSDN